MLSAAKIKTTPISFLNDCNGGRIRSSFTSTQFKSDLFIDTDFFQTKGLLKYLMNALSLKYNETHWSLTADYLRGKTTTAFVSADTHIAIAWGEYLACAYTLFIR